MKRDLSPEQLRQAITVTLPLSAVLRIAETEHPGQPPQMLGALPTIGAPWEGGIYAGLSVENEKPVALVLLPGDFKGTFAEASDWADKEGAALPSRIDQIVLFTNLKAEFKEAWYWSGEQCAGDSGCAWGQSFSGGGQDVNHKDGSGRARAVRRLPIQ